LGELRTECRRWGSWDKTNPTGGAGRSGQNTCLYHSLSKGGGGKKKKEGGGEQKYIRTTSPCASIGAKGRPKHKKGQKTKVIVVPERERGPTSMARRIFRQRRYGPEEEVKGGMVVAFGGFW